MTREQLDASINKLLVCFQPPHNTREANEEFWEMYWQMAKTLDVKVWNVAVDLCIQDKASVWFPLPGEFRRYYNSASPSFRDTENSGNNDPYFNLLRRIDEGIYALPKEERDELQRMAVEEVKKEFENETENIVNPKGFLTCKAALYTNAADFKRALIRKRMRELFENREDLL
jgi:hypothetical protein